MKNVEGLVSPGYFGNDCYADQRRYEFDIKNGIILGNNVEVDLCIIGDSIVHYFETEAYFQNQGLIINRGINGDILEHVEKRFYADVIQLKPKKVLLSVGVNDIWPISDLYNEDKMSEEELEIKSELNLKRMLNHYEGIVQEAKEHKLELMISSILPTAQTDFNNKYIVKINKEIKKICNEFNLTYIDYHKEMVKEDGITLIEDLDIDTLHPNVYGYNIMAKVLKNYI